ncbi:cysteine-rich CWC family protein [Aquabacterium sp. A7-Y]|uniref:cysteine-rich CWC family protein n=1 Tax=Aquabacterium sp. A7-Y TaxID=1349605 RepID=UPI00223D280B|nr:cysteine-rich CWC family protein [Aquabacterium sp. A7-Y]MCW7541992.1 cysteine-rich CWC family protein [Aquabacterium sp. A7-Y]
MDTTRCPLCGASNRCVMAGSPGAGDPALPCWCTTVEFDRSQLDLIPAAARGLACLCPACAARQPPAELAPGADGKAIAGSNLERFTEK